ncbi:MAG TPA: methyltransferase domain-containing protein [Bacteroidia bacterium]|nr:methyltransferase domain-containing protein [Bacteroidia bacterium]
MKPSDSSIIQEDFRRKSDTYYERNYLANKNLNRQFRQDLVRSIIRDLNISGKDFLDAGAGPGVLGEIVKENRGNYFASDISFHNIASSRKRLGNLPGVVADTCALPFLAGSFDFVFSIGSIEYIHDFPRALRELCRVSKPNGVIVFTIVSNHSPANWLNDRIFYPFKKKKMQRKGEPIYKRYFSSLSQITAILAKDNFEVIKHHYITPGILDNQLKKINFLNKLERKLIKKFNFLARTNKEIVIVARLQSTGN